jgi:hypothetical protein
VSVDDLRAVKPEICTPNLIHGEQVLLLLPRE